MSARVSQILTRDHGIEARPGAKGECPFCHHKTFSIKSDDSVGKCFRPSCGKSITAKGQGGGVRSPRRTTATAQPPDGPGCTLEQYAKAKSLPMGFLLGLGLTEIHYQGRPAVRIPYLDECGDEVAVRFRLALEKSEEGDNRFRWKQGAKPCPYGLSRREDARRMGFVVIVEGESDCHTLWYHSIPALGIPGATAWKEEWAAHLDGIPVIYVVVEDDSGGIAVLEWVSKSSIRDRVRLIALGEVKDPSGLYLADPKCFAAAWQSAMDSAVPWGEREKAEAEKRRREAWAKCETLAREPCILDRLAEVMVQLGVVGEERTAKILYLVVTSRLFEWPVSAVIKGPSSAGKSYVLENVLRLFPPSAYFDLTGGSERSLAYSAEPLVHRVLVIYEAAGLNSETGSYITRSLLSERKVRYLTVEKTKDGLKDRLIVREGPTGLILTTTRAGLHPENETRLLSLPVTDTPEQTRSVMLAVADGKVKEVDMSTWHGHQEWLAHGNCEVSIPYAKALALAIPPVSVRLRRDFRAFLNLIKAHALLHQVNRRRDEEGRTVATLEDYATVRDLVEDLMSEGIEAGVSEATRETVAAVEELTRGDAGETTVTAVGDKLGLDKSAAYRRVQVAIRMGYVKNREEKRGRSARLVLGDPLPDEIAVLPSPEALEGCAVAGENGEIGTPPSLGPVSDETREERASIMEHEGGLDRDAADKEAGVRSAPGRE